MREQEQLEAVCARCGDFVLPSDDYTSHGKVLGIVYICERCGMSWVKRTEGYGGS